MEKNNFTKEELEIIMTNNYDCFADRKDGKCHALTKKECEGCRFYTPRCQMQDNPFYRYSWTDKNKMEDIVKRYLIKKNQIME